MYGLYLHADANRIQRLLQTDEQLRFVCIRKYVEDFEKVLFRIMKCGIWKIHRNCKRAKDTIFLSARRKYGADCQTDL